LLIFHGAIAAKNVEANKKTLEVREPMPSPKKIANPRRQADIHRKVWVFSSKYPWVSLAEFILREDALFVSMLFPSLIC